MPFEHEKSIAFFMNEELSSEDEMTQTTMPDDEDHPIVVVEPKPADPVVQTPMMKLQPTELDKLPVDEPDFMPTSADELGRASRMILRDVPDETVEWMWKKIKRLRDKVDSEMDDKTFMKTETRLRNLIRNYLTEAGQRRIIGSRTGVHDDEPSDAELAAIERATGDVDLDDLPDTPDEAPAAYGRGKPGKKSRGNAIMGLSKEDEEALAMARRAFGMDGAEPDAADVTADEDESPAKKKRYITAGEEGASLKDIAKEFGVSIAKIKNDLYGITMVTRYTRWLMDEFPQEYTDTMEEFALEYIDAMREAASEDGELSVEERRFFNHLEENPMDFVSSPEYAPQFRYFISGPKVGKDDEGPYRTKMRNDRRFHKFIIELFKRGEIEKADLLAAGIKERDLPADVIAMMKTRKGDESDTNETRRYVGRIMRDPIRYSNLLKNETFKSTLTKLAQKYVTELKTYAIASDAGFLDKLREDVTPVLRYNGFKAWVLKA